MNAVDFILNVVGILLWLGWRAMGADLLAGATPATLAGTVRRTKPRNFQRGQFVFFLAILLLVRALLYVAIGPALNWVPKLDLGVIHLPFRSHAFPEQLVFSFLSFARALVIFHFWLMILAAINSRVANPDPVHRLILLQLGRAAMLPTWLQLILPVFAVALLWLCALPLVTRMEMVPWPSSRFNLALQCGLVGACLYLSLAALVPLFLLLHWISSYVYLGSSRMWDFISTTSINLLRPLAGLRIGRLDLAPLAGIVIVLAIGNMLAIVRWIAGWRWFSGSGFSRFIEQMILWPR
ncbi:MAG TPA: hypothetical protein VEH04_01755 [Verrucomicrobiae bacterium]|nr:hypothetical protein [Verrucomicrobiae bacterium]